MFRQEDSFHWDWRDKTIDSMQRRRFDQAIAQLPPLGVSSLDQLSSRALSSKLERCWQDIPCKPMRLLQEEEIWAQVLRTIDHQADCLSHHEHELIEKALILGGTAQIEDAVELEAAQALSLRLWCHVGIVSDKPHVKIERPIMRAVAKAFARPEHERIRLRFGVFHEHLSGVLYQVGALDDRQPQMMIRRDILSSVSDDEQALQLARRYLWASYDCIDYSGGVLLIHDALADPRKMIPDIRRKTEFSFLDGRAGLAALDILPEEIPIQFELEHVIQPALRNGLQSQDVARNLRFLCKQGAPLSALEEVLQSALIVYLTPAMKSALNKMYRMIPKWIECSEAAMLQ